MEKIISLILYKIFKKELLSITLKGNQLIICISENKLPMVLHFLRDNCLFLCKQLLDIFVTDYPNRKNRFEINYLLVSIKHNLRVIIRINVQETAYLPSVSNIFKSANWLEREVWDMFGIYFYNHPDLRRILTDYGFFGYPLRKDFPLTGYLEVRYDDDEKRVVLEPLEIMQEFRYFDFKQPWK